MRRSRVRLPSAPPISSELTAQPAPTEAQQKGLAQAFGLPLHAGIGIEAEARSKLERLCRYVSRPAVAEERLALTERGDVHLQLKTPYRDGSTHIVLEPLDCLARLAALVPPPRKNLTRNSTFKSPVYAKPRRATLN
jgi:hypothetical protein